MYERRSQYQECSFCRTPGTCFLKCTHVSRYSGRGTIFGCSQWIFLVSAGRYSVQVTEKMVFFRGWSFSTVQTRERYFSKTGENVCFIFLRPLGFPVKLSDGYELNRSGEVIICAGNAILINPLKTIACRRG